MVVGGGGYGCTAYSAQRCCHVWRYYINARAAAGGETGTLPRQHVLLFTPPGDVARQARRAIVGCLNGGVRAQDAPIGNAVQGCYARGTKMSTPSTVYKRCLTDVLRVYRETPLCFIVQEAPYATAYNLLFVTRA